MSARGSCESEWVLTESQNAQSRPYSHQLIFPFVETKKSSPLFAFEAFALMSGKHFTNLKA